MNRLLDLPYISFGTPFIPNEKSRKCLQFGEIMRIAFIDKEFFYVVANKKKNIAGVCSAAKIVQILKNKYPGNKLVPINVCYPNTWSDSKVKILTDLINTHTDKSNYESIIYKYLMLLM